MMAAKEKMSAGLMSAATAVNVPSRIQFVRVGVRRVRRASVSMVTKKRAEKLDSQKITGSQRTGSANAQKMPAVQAADAPNRLRESRIISAMVASEAATLSRMMASADLKL